YTTLFRSCPSPASCLPPADQTLPRTSARHCATRSARRATTLLTPGHDDTQCARRPPRALGPPPASLNVSPGSPGATPLQQPPAPPRRTRRDRRWMNVRTSYDLLGAGKPRPAESGDDRFPARHCSFLAEETLTMRRPPREHIGEAAP